MSTKRSVCSKGMGANSSFSFFTVWLRSLPFSRLASRGFAAAPQRGGSRKEGSALPVFAGGGLLGGVLGGDE